jgi:hypothetical protein
VSPWSALDVVACLLAPYGGIVVVFNNERNTH